MSNKKVSSLQTPALLQDLCEEQALSHLLHSDLTVTKFRSLEPELQEALFHTIRVEITRLKKIEKYCPRLDIQIHLPPTRTEPVGSEDDGYKQIDIFRKIWSYGENEHGKYISKGQFENPQS